MFVSCFNAVVPQARVPQEARPRCLVMPVKRDEGGAEGALPGEQSESRTRTKSRSLSFAQNPLTMGPGRP